MSLPDRICVLSGIANWFKRAKPVPTKTCFAVQLGVHFEEVAEMVDTIFSEDARLSAYLDETAAMLNVLAKYLKEKHPVAEIRYDGFLDSLCDQIVTATGCGVLVGMDIPGAAGEVNRSNWSKFVRGEPIFNEHGKIAKGPNYEPPQLAPYLNTYSTPTT